MKPSYPWDVLELPGRSTERLIKKHYARLAKRFRPDTDPIGFQKLRQAYEWALQQAIVEGESVAATQVVHLDRTDQAPASGDENLSNMQQAETTHSAGDHPILIEVSDDLSADASIQSFQTEQDDWQRAIEELHELPEVDYDDPKPLTLDQEAKLISLIDRIVQHPANSNLSTAMRTEEHLLRSAAYSHLWPHASLQTIWQQYQLDSSLAFSNPLGHIAHQIRRQLDDHEHWQGIRAEAERKPSSYAGALFREVSIFDHLSVWFSATYRKSAQAALDWCDEHPLIRKDNLSAQSLSSLTRTLHRFRYFPPMGLSQWIFLVLCALSMSVVLQPVGLRAESTLGNTAINLLFLYGLSFGLRLWLMPWIEGGIRKHDQRLDIAEFCAIPVILLCFGLGAQAPLFSALLMTLAGAWLICAWSAHHRFKELPPLFEDLGKYIGIAMLAFICMVCLVFLFPRGTSFGWPIVVLVLFSRSLPNPVLDYQEWSGRYVLRSGYRIELAAIRIWWVLLGVLFCRVLSTLFLSKEYDQHYVNYLGILVMVVAWLIVGFPQSFGRLASHLGPSGIFGGVLMSIIVIAVAIDNTPQLTQLKSINLSHLLVLSLLMIRLGELIWGHRRSASEAVDDRDSET